VSEEQVRTTRRRRSRAEAEQLVAEFEASGLGREEFCRAHGLVSSTLARYRKRRQRDQGDAAAPRRWVAVELVGSHQAGAGQAASGLAVALASGVRIEIALGFDGRTLQHLLRVLAPA
jgi:transposase-like protein